MNMVQNDLKSITIRKARYGHKDWLYWKTKDGNEQAELKTEESIKKMMKAIKETEGAGLFLIIGKNDGVGMYVNESIAQIMLNNCKYGV